MALRSWWTSWLTSLRGVSIRAINCWLILCQVLISIMPMPPKRASLHVDGGWDNVRGFAATRDGFRSGGFHKNLTSGGIRNGGNLLGECLMVEHVRRNCWSMGGGAGGGLQELLESLARFLLATVLLAWFLANLEPNASGRLFSGDASDGRNLASDCQQEGTADLDRMVLTADKINNEILYNADIYWIFLTSLSNSTRKC